MTEATQPQRRNTKQVFAGGIAVGGGSPVTIQSMTCTRTKDTQATIRQIHTLEAAGCDIVRVAVPDREAAAAITEIKKEISVPLVADIHFDHRLALASIENGADKIRINPGNIGSEAKLAAVLAKAAEYSVPVRVGVNAGSLDRDIYKRFGGVTAEALAESALQHISLCEKHGFDQLVISAKASSVVLMIETNRILAKKAGYPLHLGVTEAGSPASGVIRSAVGIGTLLAEGIGDTVRVSLTGDPVQEVTAARKILASLELRRQGVTVISCPTCGRTHTDLAAIVQEVEARLEHIQTYLTVAVMGCEVNGPGEAKEADIGVACGPKDALLFRRGRAVRKVPFSEIAQTLEAEAESFQDKDKKEQGAV